MVSLWRMRRQTFRNDSSYSLHEVVVVSYMEVRQVMVFKYILLKLKIGHLTYVLLIIIAGKWDAIGN